MVKGDLKNTINIITPVGSADGLYDTLSSVRNVAGLVNSLNFNHILIFNNDCNPKINFEKTKNYQYEICNINPIASRSIARNTGLSFITDNPNSFVIFIDAGDSFLENAVNLVSKIQSEIKTENFMIVGQTYINFSKNINLIRVPLFPITMQNIVNPFMLGSIILSTKLAKKVSFYEGKKEDWVYWKDILNLKPEIIFINEVNYVYNVQNVSEHYQKKMLSIFQLRKILIDKFKWGKINSLVISFGHIFLISCRWIFLRFRYYTGRNV